MRLRPLRSGEHAPWYELLLHQVFNPQISEHARPETPARQLKHKALRLPDELSEEVRRRARIKGFLLCERWLGADGGRPGDQWDPEDRWVLTTRKP